MFTQFDIAMMRRALDQARLGLYITDPNPRVGCVLVQQEIVVGEGFTSPVGGPHAEINALRNAGAAAQGSTAYVTLEPCSHHGRTPPCADALIAAGVRKVIYALGDPNPQVNGSGRDRLLAAGIAVQSELLSDEAREMNRGFFHRMQHSRPWVTVKVGASLDGKIALKNGTSQWITSEASREDVQKQRARSSAILTGAGTVLADDPRLTVRAAGIDMRGRNPLRVVCDAQLRIQPGAALFKEAGSVLVLTTAIDSAEKETIAEALVQVGAEVHEVAADPSGGVALDSVLHMLAARACNEVLVEAGPTLSGRFIEQHLVNELLVYIAPVVLGAQARSMFAMSNIEAMSQRWNFRLHDTTRIGDDVRVSYRRI